MSTDTAGSGQSTELRRVMGPKLLLLFIIGDILGTGVYALTGQVAAEVGGAAWLPFLVAFFVALLTAFSYLELVTKYPQAAGAALYVHKAFARALLHVHRRVRRDELRHHVGVHGVPRLRVQPRARASAGRSRTPRSC